MIFFSHAQATPIRDSLRINDPEAMHTRDEEDAHAERTRHALARRELKEALAGLPAPTNEYQIVVPALPRDGDDDRDADDVVEEDASDVLARAAAEAAAAKAAEALKRSAPVRRELPRPLGAMSLTASAAITASIVDAPGALTVAAALIATEINAMLDHDAAHFPCPPAAAFNAVSKKNTSASASASAAAFECFERDALTHAAGVLRAETDAMRAAVGLAAADDDDDALEAFIAASVSARSEHILLPSGVSISGLGATKGEVLAAAKHAYDVARSAMETDARRAAKLEQKLGVLTAGLSKRSGELTATLHESQQGELG